MRRWDRCPSSAGLVKSRVNLPGPPGKPKYFLMTDSAEYREGMVKSTPGGSEIEPETVCL